MAGIADVIKVEWSPASDPFATSPTFVDITSKVRSVVAGGGKTSALELYGERHATIEIDNTAGTISPTTWYRWRQVRITATATGPTSNVIFRGFVQEITHEQSEAPFQALAVMECADLMSIIARCEYGASGVPEELSGARVQRIIDDCAVPAGWQSFAAGNVYITEPSDQLFGVETPGQINTNALTHLQDVTESELGALYVSNAGVLTFEDRFQLRTRLQAAATVTFSDTASGTEVPYLRDMHLTPPGTDYRNSVTFIGATQQAQTASNVPANYPTDALSRTLPIVRDPQAYGNAEALLEVYRQSTVTWPMQVTLHVWPSAQNTLDKISALDLRRYCIVKETPVGSAQQTYKVVTEQISHEITPERWVTTVGFSSGDRWINAWITGKTFLLLNDATAGQLNEEQLGF